MPFTDRPVPTKIARANEHDVRITWDDGHEAVYPARYLRLSCPCAGCVEEMSGRPLLDPASVAAEVRPLSISPVGRYGVAIAFSDGHDTGIYTWDRLRRTCPCPEHGNLHGARDHSAPSGA